MGSNPCFAAGTILKALVLGPQHQTFSGCVSDTDSVAKWMPFPLELFMGHILNRDSDIIEIAEVQEVAKEYLKAAESSYGVQRSNMLRVTEVLQAVRTLFDDESLYHL